MVNDERFIKYPFVSILFLISFIFVANFGNRDVESLNMLLKKISEVIKRSCYCFDEQ